MQYGNYATSVPRIRAIGLWLDKQLDHWNISKRINLIINKSFPT